MQTSAVAEVISTIADVENRLGLSRRDRPEFFNEWQVDLPAVTEGNQQSLETLWQRYLYHCSGGNLLENTVMLPLVSPLLTVAGFYDLPFRVKAEESVSITVADSEKQLQGRLDLLVLCDSLWVIVVESKKTMLSVWSALPQTLAYLMAAPKTDSPSFAMLTNGDDIVFAKRDNQQYAVSRVFSPLVNQTELESAWKVLTNLSNVYR
ncbi:MAG: type I restriction endonuclease subunit R [Cyanobacteria bacterium P01_C01_bin.89]